ncbi:MAG: hypothetical protein N3A56_07505 [Thermodesulfobacteriaceae bacterium]|nr:hypothetical protein [Thermodesulfobacteriaceae bacterium]
MFKNLGLLFLTKPSPSLSKEELEFYQSLSFKNFIFFKDHFVEDFSFYLRRLKENLKELKFLAVDQEGGKVCRIPGEFDSPLEISRRFFKKGEGIVKSWAEKIALSLKSQGLNLNLAPCLDLGDEEAPEFLKERTFGKDSDLVTYLAKIFIKVHKEHQIFTCIKHFPGLGKVKVDPHKELPVLEKIEKEDLKPFEKLSSEVSFIMTTHLVVFSLDRLPMTLSEKGVEFLRRVLEFKGLILTDDLTMEGLKAWELPERIILSLVAGHNLLIFVGNWEDLLKVLEDLKPEVEKGKILRERIKESLFILETLS